MLISGFPEQCVDASFCFITRSSFFYRYANQPCILSFCVCVCVLFLFFFFRHQLGFFFINPVNVPFFSHEKKTAKGTRLYVFECIYNVFSIVNVSSLVIHKRKKNTKTYLRWEKEGSFMNIKMKIYKTKEY